MLKKIIDRFHVRQREGVTKLTRNLITTVMSENDEDRKYAKDNKK